MQTILLEDIDAAIENRIRTMEIIIQSQKALPAIFKSVEFQKPWKSEDFMQLHTLERRLELLKGEGNGLNTHEIVQELDGEIWLF